MKRTAKAVWNGTLKEGNGKLSTGSGAINQQPYSFRMRFENEPGTNPEELIAAAHCGCFAMALSAQLGERGITPEAVEAEATVTLENLAITGSHLNVVVRAPGADEAKAREAADAAKAGCPVSKVLNCPISMDFSLSS